MLLKMALFSFLSSLTKFYMFTQLANVFRVFQMQHFITNKDWEERQRKAHILLKKNPYFDFQVSVLISTLALYYQHL